MILENGAGVVIPPKEIEFLTPIMLRDESIVVTENPGFGNVVIVFQKLLTVKVVSPNLSYPDVV